LTSARRNRIIKQFRQYTTANVDNAKTVDKFNEHLRKKWVLPLLTRRAENCVLRQWMDIDRWRQPPIYVSVQKPQSARGSNRSSGQQVAVAGAGLVFEDSSPPSGRQPFSLQPRLLRVDSNDSSQDQNSDYQEAQWTPSPIFVPAHKPQNARGSSRSSGQRAAASGAGVLPLARGRSYMAKRSTDDDSEDSDDQQMRARARARGRSYMVKRSTPAPVISSRLTGVLSSMASDSNSDQQQDTPEQQTEVPLGYILRKPDPSFQYGVGDFVVRLDKSKCTKRNQQGNLAYSLFIEVLTEIGQQGKIMTKGQGKKKTKYNKLTIQYVILSPDDTRLHSQTKKVEFVATGNIINPKVQVQFAHDHFKSSTNIGLKTQQGDRTEPFNKIVPGSMLSLNTRTAFVKGDYVFALRSSGDYVLGQFKALDKDLLKFDFTGPPRAYTGQLDRLTDGKEHCNFVKIFPPSAQSQAIRCASQFLKPIIHPPQSYAIHSKPRGA